jgi:hypothetical protein
MALLLLGGLGIDGSRQLNARGEAVAFAEEAARAGAAGIDVAAGTLKLDEPLAEDRVDRYCVAIEKLPQVESCDFVHIEAVDPDQDPRRLVVVARVRTRIRTSLLSMIGVQELTASGIARARPYEGVEAPDDLAP